MLFNLLHAIESAFNLLPRSWVLYVNGKEKITDCPAVNDGNWHHIAVTWTCTDGAWRVYIDGKLSDGGTGLSVGLKIPGMIYLYCTKSVAFTLFLLQNFLYPQINVYSCVFRMFSTFRQGSCLLFLLMRTVASALLRAKYRFLGLSSR